MMLTNLGPVIQEGDLGTDSDSDLPPPPPPPPPPPDVDYMGALAKKLAMRKRGSPVIQEGDLGTDSDSDLPLPPPPPPLQAPDLDGLTSLAMRSHSRFQDLPQRGPFIPSFSRDYRTGKRMPSSAALDDINSYGIGTSVINIRKRSPNLSLSSLRSVLSIQQNSLWKLDESLDEMFGIDSKKCRDILQKAGLSSLGKQVTSEVFDILSSAIALLFIYKTIVPELFPLDFSNPNTMETAYTMVKERLEGMSSENASLVESLRSSVVVYKAKRQKYNWVCSMLELGHSWEVVASKMLGYTSS